MKALLLKRKRAFALYLFACLFPVVADLAGNWGAALLIGSIESKSMTVFFQSLMMFSGITVLGIVLFVISRFLRIGFMRDTILDVRLMAFDKILNTPYAQFNQKSKEIYLSNLINDINTFEQNFFLKLLNVIYMGGRYSVAVIILLFMDLKFGLGTLFVSWIVYFLTVRFESKTVSMQEAVSSANEHFSVEVANTLNGLEILKLNQVEDKFLYKTLKAVDQVELSKMRFAIFTEGQRGVTRFLTNFIFVGMMVYLLMTQFGSISLQSLTLQLTLAASCIWPIGQVIPLFNELKASLTIFNKITTVEASESNDFERTAPYRFNTLIEAKNLSFEYEGKVIFKNASFQIEPGKKYLIKGASGAGKTTLLKLLSLVEQRYEGSLTMDGVSYKTLNDVDFNANIGFIYQDVFLFEDTIKNNITLFRPDVEQRLDDTIAKAGLKDLVDSKALGIEEPLLENGKNLSGGQRQRVSIARAIFKNAEVLFVDEGTSSLNEDLGRAVEETLLDLESTVIAISHRYYEGVTERYDFVLEIKDGQVTQYASDEYFEEVAV